MIIRLRKSALLALTMTTLHLGALAILIRAHLDWRLQGLVAVVVIASFYHVIRRHVLRVDPASITAIELARDGDLWLHQRNGRVVRVHCLLSITATVWLTAIVVRPESGYWPRKLVLLPDALDAGPFRRLRVYLRRQSTENNARYANGPARID